MAFQPRTGGAALPASFRCRVCGKGKPPAAYSKTQLQKWYNKKRNDRRNEITPNNIGLTCKDHLNDQREIRCHGPCDRLHVVDHFSKRQRNDPEPWCIDCTEWRLNFDGDQVPTETPNDRLARHEFDGINDDEKSEKYPASFTDSSDDDDDDYDDDENVHPYGGSNPFTDLADRLEGYNLGAADEGVTTDVVSTTDSAGFSGWDIEDANAHKSVSGSGISTRAVTKISNSGQSVYSSVTGGLATRAGIAPHLSRWNPNAQLTRTHRPAQAGQFGDLGESTSTLSSRFSGVRGRPGHMNEDEIRSSTVTPANKPSEGWKPSGKKEDAGKQKNNKWYKGDNRRVFPDKTKALANRVQDGRDADHDSDSPDVM
ncbi:hypothetical protein GGR58DRAFT_527207 [Xylaria digitata]|nr:hypothetical protein GGR58DRAFT_527207 [Xylaria digitata]